MKTFLVLGLSLAVSATAESINFDSAEAGKSPPGWTCTKTGKGEPKWTVEKEDTAPTKPNVFKQSGEADYPVALKDDTSLKDGFVEVKFKPVSGKEDQAGGIVFRLKDANNYYVVRANALDDNVVLYKTVDGKRSSLSVKGRTFGYGVDAKVPKAKWSTLRVEFRGNLFTVSFNGKKLFDVEDDTFKAAGAVGVWTKADSVTLFDDFSFGTK